MKLLSTRPALPAVALTLLALAAGPAAAVGLNTDTSSVDAKLISALTITNTQALSFGTLVVQFPLTADVTVAMTPRANASALIASSDPAKVFPLTGEQEAVFSVTGEGGYIVQVTPSSTTIDLADGGTHHLTVQFLDIQVHNDSATDIHDSMTGQFTMPTDGDAKLELGGGLIVNTSAVPGLYTGSIDITLDYV